jgi:hypothetical protein
MLLFLFVDDFQGSHHRLDAAEWEELKALLVAEFQVKDMGASTWILGMRITRDRAARTLVLDQELYISKALARFGLSECRTTDTPATPGEAEEDDSDGAGGAANRERFMEIVGTLLYAAISTRPDIAHAVHRLTSHMLEPRQRHMVAAERVLRYLAGTKALGLTFGAGATEAQRAGGAVSVSAFADADWANSKSDRKSVTGWVAKLNGDVVSWASKKQSVVSQSTCEAELYAEAAAINEVLWLRDLVRELQLELESPSVVHGDNQSAINVSKNGIKGERTKHVAVKYAHVTQTLESGAVRLQWVRSAEQQADVLTKSLARVQFAAMRDALMPARTTQPPHTRSLADGETLATLSSPLPPPRQRSSQ